MNPALDWSEKVLAYSFSDPAFLQLALTHRSAAEKHNERLEFLGDAVLGLVITGRLFELRPETAEGGLSRLRSSLVRKEALAEIAAELKLGDLVVLGSGETRTGGHQRKSILADTLEAVIGAVFLDGGYAVAEQVVQRLYATRLGNLPDEEFLKDPKTLLQEYLQSAGLATPVYSVDDVSGPPHAQHFKVSCAIEQCELSTFGAGKSRRVAEQDAASRALQELQERD
ncbi:MAG: ribonuclease III [Gammaproteobacteria bacterium]